MKQHIKARVIATLAMLLASGCTQAEEASWLQQQRIDTTLRWDSLHTVGSQAGQDVQVGMVQVRALPRWGETWDGQLNLRARASDSARQREGNPPLLEAFVTHHSANLDVSVGKQIIVWGRADGINPTDNLTPRDQLTWLPFENDQRFGVWGVRANHYFAEGLSANVFVSPWFNPSLSLKPVLANPVTAPTPGRTLANSMLAFKLDQSGGDWDWSASFYRGPSLLADARVVGSNARGPMLETHHDRIQVWGVDAAKNIGRYGLRGEVAWMQVLQSDDGKAAVKKPNLYMVLGIDRSFDDTLNINLQWYGKWLRGYVDPSQIADPAARYVAVQNAISDGQQDRFNQGLSLRLNKKWLGETLETDVLITFNAVRHDSFIRPMLSYNVSDRMKAIVGGIYYDGKSDTLFGRKKNESRVYVELRYAL